MKNNLNNELSEILNKMIGKKIFLIDSTNYLLRVSGIASINEGKFELKKRYDRVSILIESIIYFIELKSDGKTKNFRFQLHNGHSFDLIY